MAAAVSDFFGLIGVGVELPTNMIELIPYLLNFFVGIFLVSCAFKLVLGIISVLINWRRF